ncbi:unnamed protein product [marine sediment metagenome]|uniref:Uncharacterized protein n=1 Tax=marine sediment metagenome TaxID=412755 RepID=X1T8M7_9ZZZZ
MAKHKSPSELNTKTVRINIGDWRLVMMLSNEAKISTAEAFHLLLTRQAEPKPVAVATKPAFKVPIARVALSYTSQPAIATNGSKVAAFGVMPKGARYDD